ncbi:cytochrome d ubiquinol oxidase subunit II [Amycolatopsis sp. FDAARGOS 1241]|nr:cytochrome d ubiquinol oxidase subunit II [Amycolatopsis sp. FDAARGOS 1241]
MRNMQYAWFAVILLCLGMYVLLDGYDLGIGTLTLIERDRGRKRELVEIVGTAWDGNETWLILFAVSTWAGLPGAFGVLLPALYLPVIVMLFSLVLRGAAIELISTAEGVPRPWGLAFGVGSLLASFAQGVAIGGLLSGVTVTNGVYAGGAFDFFTPYSVVTGLATVLLYATAGAAFLRLKTEGELRRHVGAAGRVLLGFTTFVTVIAALSLPATATVVHLDSPLRVTVFALTVAAAGAGLAVAWSGFARGADRRALTGMVIAEVAGVLGLVTLVAPAVVPPDITIDSARSPGLTFLLLLIGVGANIPLLVFYSWYAHHVFRGKFREQAPVRPAGLSASAHALLPSPKGAR